MTKVGTPFAKLVTTQEWWQPRLAPDLRVLIALTIEGPNLGEYAVQVQNTRHVLDLGEVINRIEKILPVLEKFHSANETCIKVGYGSWIETRIEYKYSILDFHHLIYTPELGDSQVFLEEIIRYTKLVLTAAQEGKRVSGLSFVWEPSNTNPSFYRYTLATIIKADSCPQCHKQYTKSGMHSHVGSLRCMRDAQVRDVECAGYVVMDDPAATNAIRKAGIDFKVRPQALDMWVPAWVARAIKDYRKTSDFAGLKLHEFLKAVGGSESGQERPDQEQEVDNQEQEPHE